jgi:hypothetical protein
LTAAAGCIIVCVVAYVGLKLRQRSKMSRQPVTHTPAAHVRASPSPTFGYTAVRLGSRSGSRSQSRDRSRATSVKYVAMPSLATVQQARSDSTGESTYGNVGLVQTPSLHYDILRPVNPPQ